MTKSRYMIKEASQLIRVEPHVLRYWEEELSLDIPRNDMGHRFYRKEEISLFRGIHLLKTKGFSLRAIRLLIPDMERVQKLDELGLSILKDEVDARVQELELREECAASKEIQDPASISSQTSFSSQEDSSAETTLPAKELMKNLSFPEDYNNMKDDSEESGLLQKEMVEVSTSPELTRDKLSQFQMIIGDIITKILMENNERLTSKIKDDVTDNILKEVDYMLRVQQEQQEEQFQNLIDTLSQSKKKPEGGSCRRQKKKIFFPPLMNRFSILENPGLIFSQTVTVQTLSGQ